ncbi:MAG: HU family DNA-binding protein [Nitrospinota bacterium]
MTKSDIVNRISDEAGLQKPEAEQAVETIISLVKDALGSGESVILRRFGSFQVRQKNARIGRNPKTGEEAEISARKVVRFKSGKYFKTAVNG